jgi:hypothetical protein
MLTREGVLSNIGHFRKELSHVIVRVVRRIERRRSLIERRVALVGFAAEESIEVFEAAATGRPLVEWPHRTGMPRRHLVALAGPWSNRGFDTGCGMRAK